MIAGSNTKALLGVKCGRSSCEACRMMVEQAQRMEAQLSNEALAKLMNEALLDVPIHSRKTSILVAVQTRLMKETP